MHLGSIYLIVNNFEKSIAFYEKLLEMSVTSRNMDRFAQFIFEGTAILILKIQIRWCIKASIAICLMTCVVKHLPQIHISLF